MAERSFKEEVKQLRLGAGEEFRGEGILAVTKALLQSGVAYVAGYQGAPISHLMDVLADANDILEELGVHFESSASEATAAATLAASVNYPLRGAVTFKAPVGTNVASDALANLASGGVKGGALIIVGEDYGEGSSIMQERSHAFAMKSQIWLLDPRPNLPTIVDLVEKGFELSEASNTPVMLELRIRACHVYGRFTAKDNVPPAFTLRGRARAPGARHRPHRAAAGDLRRTSRRRSRSAGRPRCASSSEHKLNEMFDGDAADIGIVLQGGMYNSVAARARAARPRRRLRQRPRVPLYVLNVTYPLIDDEVVALLRRQARGADRRGRPARVHRAGASTRSCAAPTSRRRIDGKDMLPMAGEYTGGVMRDGVARASSAATGRTSLDGAGAAARPTTRGSRGAQAPSRRTCTARPPAFCTGCPERPIFAAMKLVERELGQHHVSCDIGCHLFSILPPFNIGATTMGYGLGGAGAAALQRQGRQARHRGDGRRRLLAQRPRLLASATPSSTSSDNVHIIVDNGYSAATGGQDILSSRADNDDPLDPATRSRRRCAASASTGCAR